MTYFHGHGTNELQNRWIVVEQIGQGGFGAVHRVIDKSSGTEYALKVELPRKKKRKRSQTRMEIDILLSLQHSDNFCKIVASGRNEEFNYMVMSLTGKNLSTLRREQSNKRFSVSTSLRLSLQAIEAIKELHLKGFVHRDIKPSNFVMGQGDDSRKLYLIDFGLARRFVNPDGRPRISRIKVGFKGTLRYASINSLLLQETGPHDDLWSMVFTMVEMITGSLPWRTLTKLDEHLSIRRHITIAELLVDCPDQFELFFDHLRILNYPTLPNYSMFISTIKHKILKPLDVNINDPYDWEREHEQFVANSTRSARHSEGEIAQGEASELLSFSL